MKRKAKPGEAVLVHRTTDTGDIHSVAICAENFDPSIIEMVRDSEGTLPMGWRFEPGPEDNTLVVAMQSSPVSSNRVEVNGLELLLTTSLLPGSPGWTAKPR
jgi:hypothetical protein